MAAICGRPAARKTRMTRRFRGFTLIELLVVIAIIALLIGILIPALGKARTTARVLKCMTGVRSMGQAMTVYANDYKYWFPVMKRPAGADPNSLNNQGRCGGLAGFFSFNQQGSDGNGPGWTLGSMPPPDQSVKNPMMASYMSSFETLYCPMDRADIFYGSAWGYGRTLTQSLWDSLSPGAPGRRIPRAPRGEEEVVGYNISYLYIAGLKTDEPGIVYPPPLFGDETLGNDYGLDAWYHTSVDAQGVVTANVLECAVADANPGEYGKRDNHGDSGANFVYADGHAKLLKGYIHRDFFDRRGQFSINGVNSNRSTFVETVD
jgi:prepilin-type N-terminal cleavage/methylation domain-containing protein/prepilin-type processing-associated H-X9-DG protein